MRVKCKDNKGLENRLTINKNYSVYEGEYIVQDNVRKYSIFRIEDNCGSVIPYEAEKFEVISEVNENYNEKVLDDNNFLLIHSFIDTEYFWSRFYDDYGEMLELFVKAKKDIYAKEMKNEEMLEIINESNYDERDFIMDVLIDKRDNNFIDKVIDICSVQLGKWRDTKDLEMLFRYLSIFKDDKVNEFFINYLAESEKGNKVLDKIVYNYFD